MVTVNVEFLGGLDQTFQGVKEAQIELDESNGPVTIATLVDYLATKMITDQKDLDIFIEDGTVRPGILVLINDTDWELEDKEEYVLQNRDLVSFTSTLHGG